MPSAKARNNKQMEKSTLFYLYPDVDSDHSQNLLGYQFDQDPSPKFFY